MTMVDVNVKAGICVFQTSIQADCQDMQNASLEIRTDCPNLKPIEQELKQVDGFKPLFRINVATF